MLQFVLQFMLHFMLQLKTFWFKRACTMSACCWSQKLACFAKKTFPTELRSIGRTSFSATHLNRKMRPYTGLQQTGFHTAKVSFVYTASFMTFEDKIHTQLRPMSGCQDSRAHQPGEQHFQFHVLMQRI
jgi:hypothetical protein